MAQGKSPRNPLAFVSVLYRLDPLPTVRQRLSSLPHRLPRFVAIISSILPCQKDQNMNIIGMGQCDDNLSKQSRRIGFLRRR